MAWYMGIDIGSRTSKGVITEDGEIKARHLLFSGIHYQTTAEKLKEELLAKAELSFKEVACTIATGQGAASVTFSDQQVTDIRCCARGINSIFPAVRTIIDVEAQSSQVIRTNESGQVINFVASERCAAGSGRFLDVIANVLQIDLDDIGTLSLKAKNPITFTTSCAVFGESEAVSRVAEGIAIEDIVAGVHKALANKIHALINRVGLEKDCALSGGGGLDVGLIKSLEEELGIKLLLPPLPQFTTAFGAAVFAAEMAKIARNQDDKSGGSYDGK